mgnify:CR=1 FL=1
MSTSSNDGDVVLGDDWVTPDSGSPDELRVTRERRGLFSLRGPPLTRKIITFNLIALNILVAGILYLNASREGLAQQHANALESETILIADVFEAQLPAAAPVNLVTGDGVNVADTFGRSQCARRRVDLRVRHRWQPRRNHDER